MKNVIVGNTGVIGKTLCESINFDFMFNSSNILNFIEKVDNDSTLYLSCLPATKWSINKNIQHDLNNILKITNAINQIRFSKIILISTIDVYCESPIHSDEDVFPLIKTLNYGSNRYFFEMLIRKTFTYNDLKIFRLPSLFGKHIKKNIVYDLLNNNNIDKINVNSSYQWYDLNDLVNDINYLSYEFPKSTVFNLFSEPIETNYLIKNIFELKNITNNQNRIEYNYKTKFNKTGYIQCKNLVIEKLMRFKNEYINK